ncbi:hypothetical protein RIF29_41529 [Crotalaria pallida]|uniref:SCP domain-containing protein n=1 Tax=Crotalaria pallida TaxID=3830 RepID=A0AAN9HRL7_CROPI
MGPRHVSLSQFFFCVLALAIVSHVANAQDSKQDYLDAHNAARSEVNVPNLVWDDTVAAFAQNYADQRRGDCNLIHSGGGGIYGENLAMSTGDMSGKDAVNLWVDEKPNFNYNEPIPNCCVGGQQCLHYTQVVWRNTKSIGCAKVKCNNGGTFITCNYYPPGNYVGQKPY